MICGGGEGWSLGNLRSLFPYFISTLFLPSPLQGSKCLVLCGLGILLGSSCGYWRVPPNMQLSASPPPPPEEGKIYSLVVNETQLDQPRSYTVQLALRKVSRCLPHLRVACMASNQSSTLYITGKNHLPSSPDPNLRQTVQIDTLPRPCSSSLGNPEGILEKHVFRFPDPIAGAFLVGVRLPTSCLFHPR